MDLSRFTKYTTGEPVITVNAAAAVVFGLFVTLTERYAGFQWDELMLTLTGVLFLSVATWLARSQVFSPKTHAAEVRAALMQEPPK